MTKKYCIRQHYIPQFLQKGFTYNKEESMVNVVTRIKTYQTNIKNNYVENQFYSEIPENDHQPLTLDQKITEKEHEVLPILNSLKNLPCDTEFKVSLEYSNFLFHFILRNKQFSKELAENTLNEIINKNSDILVSEACKIFVEKYGIEIFEHMKIIHKIELSREKKRELEKQPQKIKNEVYKFIQPTFIEEKNKCLHILKQSNVEFRRIINSFSLKNFDSSFLENWKFKIIKGNFILPDTVIISYSNDWPYNFVPIIGNECSYTIFPIQEDKVMILYPNIYPEKKIFDETKINQYLISNSDLFITKDISNNSYINDLKKLLNQNLIEKSFKILLKDESEQHEINRIFKNLEENLISILREKTGYKPNC